MNASAIDMTSGRFLQNIIRFAFPLMLMSMLQIFFAACDDMFILGLFVGSEALAAVGATTYIVNLFINGFAGLSVGVNVVVAQLIGAGDKEKAGKAVHTAVASALLLSVVIIILLDTPKNIIDTSTLYLRIYFLSTPASLLFSFSSAVMRADGDSRHPFYYLTVAGIADVVLCTFLVLALDLGVKGVAIGTVLSQYISASLAVFHLMRETGICHLNLKKLCIQKTLFRRILAVGIPSGLNNIAFSFSNMQLQGAINTFGSAAVAGCSVSATMENFIYACTNSIMQACITFTGQNTGAGKLENIPKIVRVCFLYSSLIGTLLGLSFYFLGYPLLPFFIDENSFPYAVSRNLVVMIPYGLCGIMEVYAGVQRGLGNGIYPTLVTLIGVCLFRVIWVHTAFAAVPTIEMLFLSYPLSWGMTAAAHFIFYRHTLRKVSRVYR